MSARKFTWILKVGQVLVVSDDGDRMRCTLNVLTPFSESKDDCKEFAVINIVVSFGWEESTREVGTRMEITVGIRLEQDGACCEQRGVGHNGKWSSNIRNR